MKHHRRDEDQAPRRGLRRLALGLGLCAAAVAIGAGAAGFRAATAASATAAATRATRADLDGAQRRAARLESEVALASTRRPYLVLDLEEKMLRYRLMGMTMREVPIPALRIEGLLPSNGGAADSPALAGIVSLKEKEGDPRLNPLSPEQVEDGADDENAANVLPPEVPKEYRLTFNQKIAVRVAGEEEARGVSKVGAWFRSATARLRGVPGDEAVVRIRLALDPAIAIEVYRSLLPDQRWLVLPPQGYRLPEVGQEPPPKPKPSRPQPTAPARPPKQPDADRGVPFAIPPPMEPPVPNGSDVEDPNRPVPPAGDAEPPPEPPKPPDAQRLPDGGT
jgi:hypothetical protein